MSELWKYSGGGRKIAFLLAALFCASCGTTPEPSRLPQHVVLLWLKHPGRAADRAQLIRAAQSVRMIPGVVKVDAGDSAPEVGPRIDRNFDLAVVITFRDVAALKRYQEDPRRRAAMKRYLGPLVRRYEVYDLGVR